MTPRSDVAARLVLIEEHLAAIEPLLLRIESALPIPSALSLVANRLGAIDKKLAERVPVAEIRQAIEDILNTYNIVSQLKEVYDNQRNQLTVLIGMAAAQVAETKEGDQEILDLLVQLRELGRKHVRAMADLEKLHDWHEKEAERRSEGWSEGDVERRKASGE